MSKRNPSTEIDKQLQETFSVYIVDPMHKDIEGQLANLQKKWLGDPELEDEDTPYLETFMDNRLDKVNSKLAKQQMETSKQFQKLTSILEGISDHTDQIDQVADTAENVSESILSVEKSVSALDKSLTALSNDVKEETTGLRANIAANTESVLDAISASKKNNHTSVQTAADKVEQKLSKAVDELSRRMEQDHTAQQEQLEEIWIRFGALAEQFSTERKKLYHILYLSLAMNSVTLIGLVATLLMLLLGA